MDETRCFVFEASSGFDLLPNVAQFVDGFTVSVKEATKQAVPQLIRVVVPGVELKSNLVKYKLS